MITLESTPPIAHSERFPYNISAWIAIAGILCLLMSCGGGDSGGDDGGGGVNVTGSLRGTTSDVLENVGWSVVFSDQRTGICRIGAVGLSGQYEVRSLPIGSAMTVLLLDGSFKLQSVLSFPGLELGRIRQFFTFASDSLPPLAQEGGIVKFTDTTSLTLLPDWALDSAGISGDGIPDGMDRTATSLVGPTNTRHAPQAQRSLLAGAAAASPAATPVADTDADQIANSQDPDIDGDGIVNRFDVNITGIDSAEQNIFTNDANGTAQADILETVTESHFSETIEYYAVQTIQVMTSATEMQTYLNFTTKLRGAGPNVISIYGSEDTFTDAAVVNVDPTTGIEAQTIWDLTLADDGLNGDGEANDLIYSRKIALASGIVPTAGEVVFARLQYGLDESLAYYLDFPYIFPKITTHTFNPSLTNTTITLNLTDAPFRIAGSDEGINNLNWIVQVYDETKEPRRKLFHADPINLATLEAGATSTTYTIPSGALSAGSYTAYVVLQAHGIRLPGMPQWSIVSLPMKLTIP